MNFKIVPYLSVGFSFFFVVVGIINSCLGFLIELDKLNNVRASLNAEHCETWLSKLLVDKVARQFLERERERKKATTAVERQYLLQTYFYPGTEEKVEKTLLTSIFCLTKKLFGIRG